MKTRENSIIKVIGVGGGGCNAVTYMYNQHIQGCSFIVCNTDSQALEKSNVPIKIRIGDGLGAGTNPAKARNAALESQDVIAEKVVAGHQAALADLISLAARLSGIPRKRLTLLKP